MLDGRPPDAWAAWPMSIMPDTSAACFRCSDTGASLLGRIDGRTAGRRGSRLRTMVHPLHAHEDQRCAGQDVKERQQPGDSQPVLTKAEGGQSNDYGQTKHGHHAPVEPTPSLNNSRGLAGIVQALDPA